MTNLEQTGREGPRQRRARDRRQAPRGPARPRRPALPRPPPDRGRARHRQDRPGEGHRPQPRLQLPADPVHAGPAAVGRDRPLDLQPEDPGVRVPAGADHGQVVLADEINRATPKTQSALLEAMEERQATVDGTTYAMPDPFLVIATQNPIEYEGTFALPEAQLDRFMLRIRLGYPQPIEEVVILDEQKRRTRSRSSRSSARSTSCAGMQDAIRDIYVDSTVADYIVRLVNGTRDPPRRLPRRVAARLDRAVPRGPGPGRPDRPRLRDPRRHQGARRAGPRPPADHQDELVDPRRPVGERHPRAARRRRRSTASARPAARSDSAASSRPKRRQRPSA